MISTAHRIVANLRRSTMRCISTGHRVGDACRDTPARSRRVVQTCSTIRRIRTGHRASLPAGRLSPPGGSSTRVSTAWHWVGVAASASVPRRKPKTRGPHKRVTAQSARAEADSATCECEALPSKILGGHIAKSKMTNPRASTSCSAQVVSRV
eukprot:394058-Rhodomonas_salina.2